jgi:N-acetylglucosamine-6-sulfatase
MRRWASLLLVVPFMFTATPPSHASNPPNVVILLSDDETLEMLQYMPIVRRTLIDHGVSFDNAMTPNALCCPSRASILTGLYSHNTTVWDNGGRYGGFEAFTHSGHDQSTLATWLHDAGYRTGLFGKYLNGYAALTSSGQFIPPGWDAWSAFTDVGYFNYSLSNGTTATSYEGAPYATSHLADEAVRFIQRTPSNRPLFLYYAPYNPHKEHAQPVAYPEFASDVRTVAPLRPPSFNEGNVRDKPSWIRRKPRVGSDDAAAIDDLRSSMIAAVQSVDRAVGDVVRALDDTGRLANTIIIFMSDNGYLFGEHRDEGKNSPYDMAIRVPLVIRYDALQHTPFLSHENALNIDLAPTIADLTGVEAPPMDGISLRPILERRARSVRNEFVLEGGNAAPKSHPPYCGARSRRFMYVRYADGQEEFYDYRHDPYELTNKADSRRRRVRHRIRSLRHYAMVHCAPPYIGYSWRRP